LKNINSPYQRSQCTFKSTHAHTFKPALSANNQ